MISTTYRTCVVVLPLLVQEHLRSLLVTLLLLNQLHPTVSKHTSTQAHRQTGKQASRHTGKQASRHSGKKVWYSSTMHTSAPSQPHLHLLLHHHAIVGLLLLPLLLSTLSQDVVVVVQLLSALNVGLVELLHASKHQPTNPLR